MRKNFFSYKQFLYSLNLPLDMIRVIKDFLGEYPKPKLIRDYDNYSFVPRNRHRKRIYSV